MDIVIMSIALPYQPTYGYLVPVSGPLWSYAPFVNRSKGKCSVEDPKVGLGFHYEERVHLAGGHGEPDSCCGYELIWDTQEALLPEARREMMAKKEGPRVQSR